MQKILKSLGLFVLVLTIAAPLAARGDLQDYLELRKDWSKEKLSKEHEEILAWLESDVLTEEQTAKIRELRSENRDKDFDLYVKIAETEKDIDKKDTDYYALIRANASEEAKQAVLDEIIRLRNKVRGFTNERKNLDSDFVTASTNLLSAAQKAELRKWKEVKASKEAYEKGYSHMEADRYKKAIAAFKLVSQLDDQHAMAMVHSNIAYSHHQLDQYKKAINSYKKALELNDNLAEAHEGKGMTHLALGNVKLAKGHLASLEELDPIRAESLRAEIEGHKASENSRLD